jgi:hypothetical protein
MVTGAQRFGFHLFIYLTWSCYAAQAGLELLLSCLYLQSAGITGMTHALT